jgi:hypothetical protein
LKLDNATATCVVVAELFLLPPLLHETRDNTHNDIKDVSVKTKQKEENKEKK